MRRAARWIAVSLGLGTLGAPACGTRDRTIVGQVVDPQGRGLAGAAVRVCVTEWGWSQGGLVWDKIRCSEPVLTTEEGGYAVDFRGPRGMRVLAAKPGWVQTADAPADRPRVVLERVETVAARRREEARSRERRRRARRPGESDASYYCRVVLPRSDLVTLRYREDLLEVAQALLEPERAEGSGGALFAVRGSRESVAEFAREAQARVDGRFVDGRFTLRSRESGCAPGVHLLGLRLPSHADPATVRSHSVGLLVPSIKALFAMHLWGEEQP